MPEVYELKSRIEGLKSIHNITYAMQIVTISRLKRIITGLTRISDANSEVSGALRYLVTENNGLYNRLVPVVKSSDDQDVQLDALVIVFSNRGFCGSYNQDVLNSALEYCKLNNLDFASIPKICVGKKSADVLKRLSLQNVTFFACEKDTFSDEEVRSVYSAVKAHVELGANVHVVYYGFKSIVTQKVAAEMYYPPSQDEFPAVDELVPGVPFFVEQPVKETFDTLRSQYYFLKLLQVIRSAASSEFSQRFLLMKGAVDNVKSLSDELLIELNKQRQAGITQEVAEIISTFKSLAKDK